MKLNKVEARGVREVNFLCNHDRILMAIAIVAVVVVTIIAWVG